MDANSTEFEPDITVEVKRPGPKPKFNLDDLVREALSQGVDSFSLSAIAKSLGVASPALYRIVSSRTHLLYACFDVISPDMPKGETGEDWKSVVAFWAEEMWAVCDKYPGLDEVLIECPDTPSILRSDLRKFVQRVCRDKLVLVHLDAVESVVDTVLVSHLSASRCQKRQSKGDTRSTQLRDDIVLKFGVDGVSRKTAVECKIGFAPVSRKVKAIIETVECAAKCSTDQAPS